MEDSVSKRRSAVKMRPLSRRGVTVTHPGGRVQTFDVDDDRLYIETKQDVQPVLDANAALRAELASARPGVNAFTHTEGAGALVARIPTIVYYQHPPEWWEDERNLRSWLNDPANSGWRVLPGRV